jgi:hypothetical protein
MSNEPTPRTDDFLSRNLSYMQKRAYIMKLERELTEVTKQRDKLAEALRFATAYTLSESWYKQAIEALATLKPCD